MKKYDKLLQEIKLIEKQPDIIDNEEVISLYSFYNIINDGFEDLRSVIDKDYINNLEKRLRKYYFNKLSLTEKLKFYKDYSASIIFGNDDIINSSISTWTYCSELNEGTRVPETKICINHATNEWYFKDCYRDNILVEKFYDDFEKIFNVLGKYSISKNDFAYTKNNREVYSNVFNGFLFKAWIETNGYLSVDIYPEESTDLVEYNKLWYLKPSIKEIVENEKLDILKKVPVSINDLPYFFKDYVSKYYKGINTLIRKLEK